MSVLFILPTYRHFEYAKRAACSFLANTPDGQVALIDDGSPDWLQLDWRTWPRHMLRHHFRRNDRNLTRSWNYGLDLARQRKFEYAIAGNSDLVFAAGWWPPIEKVLSSGKLDLVGPLTNAPGPVHRQRVDRHLGDFRPSDEQKAIDKTARRLWTIHGDRTVESRLNGFCLIARTEVWWGRGANGPNHVFNPRYKMTRNEDELIGRWRDRGLKVGLCLGSYVFHYRGVSRDLRLHTHGALRMRRD